MPAHFLNTPDPPIVKGSMQALCGRNVDDAVAVEPPIDNDSQSLVLNSARDCGKCIKKGFSDRYVTRIVPAGALKRWKMGDDFETL